jgi:hypothetical protein
LSVWNTWISRITILRSWTNFYLNLSQSVQTEIIT